MCINLKQDIELNKKKKNLTDMIMFANEWYRVTS